MLGLLDPLPLSLPVPVHKRTRSDHTHHRLAPAAGSMAPTRLPACGTTCAASCEWPWQQQQSCDASPCLPLRHTHTPISLLPPFLLPPRSYVMDTYSSPHNRRTNHGLAAFHAYASWGVVAPTVTGARAGMHQGSSPEERLRAALQTARLPWIAARVATQAPTLSPSSSLPPCSAAAPGAVGAGCRAAAHAAGVWRARRCRLLPVAAPVWGGGGALVAARLPRRLLPHPRLPSRRPALDDGCARALLL